MIFPSYEQFSRWADRYSVVPFFCSIPLKSDDGIPYFFSQSSGFENTFFLDGYRAGPNARYSYFPLTAPQSDFRVNRASDFPGIWERFQDHFRQNQGPVLPRNLPSFYGGAAGIFSYDAGRFFEKGWRSPSPPDSLKFPLMQFGIFNDVACLDHETRRLFIFSCLNFRKQKNKADKEVYQRQKIRLLNLVRSLKEKNLGSVIPECFSRESMSAYDLQLRKDRFLRSVSEIKEYIAAGDIYQANLSQRIEMPLRSNSLDFFRRLRKINPSPYACYFKLSGFELISCSPELLLQKRGKILESRPIAGTRPRGANRISDQKLEGELILNEKERAEHIMLVDLERNDLGRVCKEGSVKVTERMAVEKYSHVMHIVSNVVGEIKEKEDVFSVIAALFPGGTITGCPKVRCMEILDEIEPVSRGPFFGSAGWIGYQGDADFNILIRTAVVKASCHPSPVIHFPNVYLQVGSGIVADSDPQREYEESLHKAGALLKAL